MLSVRQAPRMGMRALAACGVVISLSAQAHAHFKLDAPACYMSQDATGFPQKGAPCGPPDSPAGTLTMAVTSYQPGQMVTIKVTPTIPHSGWWRVALHTGKSSTQTTTTLPEAGVQSSEDHESRVVADSTRHCGWSARVEDGLERATDHDGQAARRHHLHDRGAMLASSHDDHDGPHAADLLLPSLRRHHDRRRKRRRRHRN
jgi:hypothetical protein